MKTKMMQIPGYMVGAVNRMLMEDRPAKPIKRVRKISDAELAKMFKRAQIMKRDLNRIERECERLEDMFDRPGQMSASDEAWLEREGRRFNKVRALLDPDF